MLRDDLIHPAMAVGLQVLLGIITGSFTIGAFAGAAMFIGRELAQAEYRWIERYGSGRRANMPWYGSVDPKVWNRHSLLGLVLPIPVVTLLAVVL